MLEFRKRMLERDNPLFLRSRQWIIFARGIRVKIDGGCTCVCVKFVWWFRRRRERIVPHLFLYWFALDSLSLSCYNAPGSFWSIKVPYSCCFNCAHTNSTDWLFFYASQVCNYRSIHSMGYWLTEKSSPLDWDGNYLLAASFLFLSFKEIRSLCWEGSCHIPSVSSTCFFSTLYAMDDSCFSPVRKVEF